MTSTPHLLFAEVLIDLARGEFRAAHDKLVKQARGLPESYLYHLLHARTFRGLENFDLALNHLKLCCKLAPLNQIAWQELADVASHQARHRSLPVTTLRESAFDPMVEEYEKLSAALSGFTPPRITENADPTPLAEQNRAFPDEASISVPTESLANLFVLQCAYKKAIRVYTSLILLNPWKADHYRKKIEAVLDKM